MTKTTGMNEKNILKIKAKLAEMQKLHKNGNTPTQAVTKLNREIGASSRSVLKDYPNEYIDCRDMGHVWGVSTLTSHDVVLDRVLICERCGMERTETITQYGTVLSRHYFRPDDYSLPKSTYEAVGASRTFWRGLQYVRAQRGFK
jgi:hypothetical protein